MTHNHDPDASDTQPAIPRARHAPPAELAELTQTQRRLLRALWDLQQPMRHRPGYQWYIADPQGFNIVWCKQRSLDALLARGLVTVQGDGDDALAGLTALGSALTAEETDPWIVDYQQLGW